MKKIIKFLVMVLFCFSTIKAQTYSPLFVPDSTEWSVHVAAFGFADGWYTITASVNDSILSFEEYNDSFNISQSTDYSKAWIYNDSVGKKLLVYDISLLETDSFKFYTFQNNILDSTYIYVDTIYLENGRKTIEFNKDLSYNPFNINDEFPNWKFKFIEGVGPNNFFYYPFLFQDYPINVICKTFSEQTIYEIEDENYYYEDCKIKTKIKDLPLDKFNIKVENNNILIGNSESINISRIQIVDLLGRKLFDKESPIEGFQKIKIEANGILILVIETKTGVYSQKIYMK